MDNNQNNTDQEFQKNLSNSEANTNQEFSNSATNSEPDTNQEFSNPVTNSETNTHQEFQNPVANTQSYTNQVSQNPVTNKQSNSNNKFLIIVALLIIAIAGASYFTFLRKDVKIDPETHLEKKGNDKQNNDTINYMGYIFEFPSELDAKLNDVNGEFIAIKNYTKDYKGLLQIQNYYCSNLLNEKADLEKQVVDFSKGTLLSSKIYNIGNSEWLISEAKDSKNMYWYEAISKITDSQIALTVFRSSSLDPNITYKDITSVLENRKSEDRDSNHIEYIEPKDSIRIEGDIDYIFE